jgi:hypothetical protein
MKKKRDIFAELTEGFDALKSKREDKHTPPPAAPTPAHLKTGSKAAPDPTPKQRC